MLSWKECRKPKVSILGLIDEQTKIRPLSVKVIVGIQDNLKDLSAEIARITHFMLDEAVVLSSFVYGYCSKFFFWMTIVKIEIYLEFSAQL